MKGIDMKKISSIIFLLVLVLFILASCENSSSDWVKYKDDNDGNIYSYNKENIAKDSVNYMVQVWEKQAYSDIGREKEIQDSKKDGFSTEEWDNLSYETDLLEIDCMMRRHRILSILFYDTDGKVSWSYNYDKPKWTSIVSDSEMDSLQKEVCK